MDEWLRTHSLIYMAVKEPHFFNTDHKNRFIKTLSDYQALFSAATDSHVLLGETSVRYLYSQAAVTNILAYNPDAKFIVMLRNPVDMAYSWHNQVYFSGIENIRDFEAAWALQEQRLQGRHIPASCQELKMLFYGQVCRLGEQLQRLAQKVPLERIHIILFDDLKEQPRQIYRQVLKFLEVRDDNRSDFPIYNPAKTYYIHSLPGLLRYLGQIKKKMRINRGFGVLEYMRKKNMRIKERPLISKQMRQTLIDYFHDDIQLLSRLINRNLDHWTRD